MPIRSNPKKPGYNPHRPQDSEEYYDTAGLRCTECSSPDGNVGEQCGNMRESRNRRCSGTLYIECGDWEYRYSSSSIRRMSFKIGWCTFEREHSGPCSWKVRGAKCTECEGRGWRERVIMGVWGPADLHGYNPDWKFTADGESRLPRELGREKDACMQCGGSGRMP